MSLIEKLQTTDSKKGILFIAIETLIKPNEIIKFYQEYADYIKSHGALI